MAKFGIFASLTAIFCALGLAMSTTTATADEPKPCMHKEFKTELVKNACGKGGQDAAKDAMKAFAKDKKIKSCNQCHTKLAPNYELKDDGVKQFNDLGGK